VIVDLAAPQGGNVVGAKPGETVDVNGVKIIGPVNLPSTVAVHSSQLYSNNLRAFVEILFDKEGNFAINMEDEILEGSCVVKDGKIYNERVKGLLN
jgi:NAD(P) transhydrogenase subunit alpha